jgi:pentatricopeptide repeat protein
MALSIASKNADVSLTKDIILYLKDGLEKLCQEHYDMLIDAHVGAGNIKDAFLVLSEMNIDLFNPDHRSARSIFKWFKDNPSEDPLEYLEHLRLLKLEHKFPPPAALNLLIEAAVKQHHFWSESAIALYERCRFALDTGPDNITFYHMFELSRKLGNMKLTLNLEEEHKLMGLQADAVFYDGLILACITNGKDTTQAITFYKRMMKEGITPYLRTLKALYQILALSFDSNAPVVLEEYEKLAKTQWEVDRLLEETTRDIEKVQNGEKVHIYAEEPLYDTLPNKGAYDLAVYMDSIKDIDGIEPLLERDSDQQSVDSQITNV